MKWTAPLQHQPKPARPVRKDGVLMPELRVRSVHVDGVFYGSMVEACRALGWSYSRVYRAIGENWRYAK